MKRVTKECPSGDSSLDGMARRGAGLDVLNGSGICPGNRKRCSEPAEEKNQSGETERCCGQDDGSQCAQLTKRTFRALLLCSSGIVAMAVRGGDLRDDRDEQDKKSKQ